MDDGTPDTSVCIGGFHYTNQNLLFLQHAEGRALKSGNSWSYQYNLTDHLGNVRVTVDESGSVVQRDDYYPFGAGFNHWNASTGSENLYKYNGKEEQKKTGWYDYGARMYDGWLGRWNGIDLFADQHTDYTPYAYVYNNPIAFTDQFGLDTLLVDSQGRFSENKLKGGDNDVIIKVSSKEREAGQINYKKGKLRKRHITSKGFEKESINISETSKGTAIVTSNEQSEDVFNFLADNTQVEFSRIHYINITEGDSENIIASSNGGFSKTGAPTDQYGSDITTNFSETSSTVIIPDYAIGYSNAQQ